MTLKHMRVHVGDYRAGVAGTKGAAWKSLLVFLQPFGHGGPTVLTPLLPG